MGWVQKQVDSVSDFVADPAKATTQFFENPGVKEAALIAAAAYGIPALAEASGLGAATAATTGSTLGAMEGALTAEEIAALPGLATVGSTALTPAALESLAGTTGYGVNASAIDAALAAGIDPAIVGSGGAGLAHLTPAALESLIGTPGYGVNASAVDFAIASGLDPALVGAGAYGTSISDLLNAANKVKGLLPKSATGSTATGGAQKSGLSELSGLSDPTLNSAGRLATVGPSGYTGKTYSENLDQLAMPQENPFKYASSADIADINFSQIPTFAKGGLAEDVPSTSSQNLLATADKYMSQDTPKAAPPQLIRLQQIGMSTPPKVLPQLAALLQARGMKLAEGGQPDDHTHPNYDGVPLLRTGGLTGLGGKYVEGKGDGTSDDIAAMLANGEYVFSADVVAALGNGSNKAGAEELDRMVHAIRERARSAPADKLPPDAKSPLEYLKSSKGKMNG